MFSPEAENIGPGSNARKMSFRLPNSFPDFWDNFRPFPELHILWNVFKIHIVKFPDNFPDFLIFPIYFQGIPAQDRDHMLEYTSQIQNI